MKNRIFALSILLFKAAICSVPFLCHNTLSVDTKENVEDITTETKTGNAGSLSETSSVSIETDIEIIVSQPNPDSAIIEENGISLDDLKHQMDLEIEQISYDFDDIKQKEQWFISYKKIVSKYPDLHIQTIYDEYSEEELDLLFRIVQSEAGDEYDFYEKANVCSVIFNRLGDKRYNSLTDVLTAKNQFSPYSSGRYLKVEIDSKTILACEYVFLFGDTTDGCYGFQMKKVEDWNGWEWIFKDDCHHFYRRRTE